jgi:hypothetical protein
MIKKTAWFFLFSLVCLSAANAQIGRSVDEFRQSKFAAAEGFTFLDSYQLTDDPVYRGKFAFNFFTADKRYNLQLIADKKGRNIVFEYLFYSATDDVMLSLKDGSISLAFIAQASADTVLPEAYISLVAETNGGARNKKYSRVMSGYTVSLTRFDTKKLSGWSIGIHK